jgi:hypothetical protein
MFADKHRFAFTKLVFVDKHQFGIPQTQTNPLSTDLMFVDKHQIDSQPMFIAKHCLFNQCLATNTILFEIDSIQSENISKSKECLSTNIVFFLKPVFSDKHRIFLVKKMFVDKHSFF